MRTVPVCTLGDTTEAEMKSYCLAALAPLATKHPPPHSGGRGDPGVPGRGTKAIATENLQIELPEFDSKYLPEWAQEFSEFLLLTGQQNAEVRTKCTLIKKSCKRKFLQRQAKAAIRRSSNWGTISECLFFLISAYPCQNHTDSNTNRPESAALGQITRPHLVQHLGSQFRPFNPTLPSILRS